MVITTLCLILYLMLPGNTLAVEYATTVSHCGVTSIN